MSRRQVARTTDEPIPEELLASIPTLSGGRIAEATTFAIESEEILPLQPVEDAAPAAPQAPATGAIPSLAPAPSANLAHQLRYELGEALASALDAATETMAATVRELEARVAAAEKEANAARVEAERERAERAKAEERLKAFKELALR